MSAPILARPIKSVPWGLVATVALALLIERFVSRHQADYLTWLELDWRAAGIDARRAARSADVLLFGDSMVKFGVSPRILESRLGCSVYSLALLNGRPAASYYLLRRILKSGARPKLVVVDYHPECMYEEGDHLLAQKQWKALLSLGECLDLALAYRDGAFFARTMLARVIPSVRCQPGIRRSVVCAVQEISNPTPDENAKVARNRVANRGGMILASKPTYAGEINPKAMKAAADPGWLGRDEHAVYIDRFIALAGRHGIAVVWLLPPNVPRAEQERARLGLDRRYNAFIAPFQRRHSNLVVVDCRYSGFDHTYFVDHVHLDRRGATALSLGLTETLQSLLLARPSGRDEIARWVALPPPTREHERVALEDVDQSGNAVGLRRVRR